MTSSNLNGRWAPVVRLARPGRRRRASRAPLPAARFGNVTAFSMDGTVLETIQLGAYPSGMEPFTVGVGGHESM